MASSFITLIIVIIVIIVIVISIIMFGQYLVVPPGMTQARPWNDWRCNGYLCVYDSHLALCYPEGWFVRCFRDPCCSWVDQEEAVVAPVVVVVILVIVVLALVYPFIIRCSPERTDW